MTSANSNSPGERPRDKRLSARPPAEDPTRPPAVNPAASPFKTAKVKPVGPPGPKRRTTHPKSAWRAKLMAGWQSGAALWRRPGVRWGLAIVAALVCLGVLVELGRKFRSDRSPAQAARQQGSESPQPLGPAVPSSSDRRVAGPTVSCRIDTPEPEFFVFVDGEPARNVEGELLLTPCEVAIERGDRQITVAKKGWREATERVNLQEARDFDFESVFEPFAAGESFFAAPYFQAPVGEPIPLAAVNTLEQIADPFLSADLLSLWFAGSGPEGEAIYQASRSHPFGEFGPPAQLVLSRSTSAAPLSPSATADMRYVAFALKGRVGGLFRETPDATFDKKEWLAATDRTEAECQSAQISGDGKRLYWREEHKGKAATYFIARKQLDTPFGKPRKISLPGGHPCLSRDELRQYAFDGKTLGRAQRRTPDEEFGPLETIAELHVPNYTPQPARRQFCITEDEQWLYYAAGGDGLYAFRISVGPLRGSIPRGRAVPPRSSKPAAQDPEMAAGPQPTDEPRPAPPDPRSLPVPYEQFQQQLAPLLETRNYQQAANLVREKQADPQLAGDLQLLGWDAAEMVHLQSFWQDLERTLGSMQPGDPIRVNGIAVEFKSYDAPSGLLVAQGKTKTVEKKLAEMKAADLVALVEGRLDKSDAAAQLRVGAFLFYDSKGESKAAASWLQRAGPAGAEFDERQAQRRLRLIEQELKREKLSIALKLIDELLVFAPKSPSSQTAAGYRDNMYTFVKWRPAGPRKWDTTADGAYTAASGKQRNSYLVSPREYGNFELSLEWKTVGELGQGGVYFRYPGSGNPLETAFKIHLANDSGIRPDKFCTGALFNVTAPSANRVAPNGEWNTLHLRVIKERVQVTINGTKVLETTATDPEIPLRGYLALDGALGGITYRKILLVDLPDG